MPTAFITGGSRGIGAETVRQLSREGWQVAFCYCSDDAAAAEVANQTGALAIKADVADSEAMIKAVGEINAHFGDIDLLVNNAAISFGGLFTHVSAEKWQRMLAVNVNGVFNSTAAVLPQMINNKRGKIINISSVWGQVGASCEVHYSTTKAAVIGFTKALAKEVGPSGITVNCIAPGVIDTDMNGHLSAEDMAALAEDTPLCRIGKCEDVARAVSYLASSGADFITGQVLTVDGGFAY